VWAVLGWTGGSGAVSSQCSTNEQPTRGTFVHGAGL
jgi:hypothetical protein